MCHGIEWNYLQVAGLHEQVCIGRGTTWQGCETNFLSHGPDVISLNSIDWPPNLLRELN